MSSAAYLRLVHPRSFHARWFGAGLLAISALQFGCAVPLGPGFGHESRQISVSAAPTEPAQVHVRVTDALKNNGNRNLAYLDADLPPDAAAGKSRAAFHQDGLELQATQSQPGGAWRVRFSAPVELGGREAVVVDYDLPPLSSSRGMIGATPDSLYVADRAAFPSWLVPAGIFSTGDRHARAESIEVSVPSDFRVLAPGQEQRTTRNGPTAVHPFIQRRWEQSAFVIAGRYQESRIRTSRGAVIFWSFQPLAPQAEQVAAARLAATAATYRKLFGPTAKRPWTLHIVEARDAAPSATPPDDDIRAASFPQGVLIGEPAMQRLASEPVLERAEYELAIVWFGWHVRSSPEAQLLLSGGLSWYAVTRAALARGGESARRQEIAQLLAHYDAARQRGQDGPLLRLPADAPDERRATYACRAGLFLVALEDLVGRTNFDAALKRMLNAARLGDVDADELRSALEASSGQDLSGIFRTWLGGSSVPDDFRARYVQ